MTLAQSFRSVADLLPEALLLVSTDGVVLAANPVAAERLDLTQELLAGRPLAALVDNTAAVASYLRACARSGQPVPGALTLLKADGTRIPCRCDGALYRLRAPDSPAAVMLRLTPRPVASQRFVVLTQKIDELAHEIHERRRAEDALRQADRKKDEFLALLAHELRNPLGPIRNAVQVLTLSGPKEPMLQQAYDLIARQVTHMARLIDDLLDVSRIARGKISLRRERLDLARLVRQTAEDYRSLLSASGLTLALDVAAEPLWVEGDPTRLAQLLGNLLHNAHKFTDPGGRVEVRAAVEAGQAMVSVRDTGIGIEPALLARLFEPFAQAEQGLSRSRGGLGLGLALVKGLVELHGGRVEAASAGVGQGSEFSVYLPRQPEPAQPPPLAAPEQPRSTPSDAARRVLVIEDNRDAADSLALLLTLSGYETQTAYSGPAGLDAAQAFRPHIVLCDIGLPELDGYEVARRLRAEGCGDGAYLIALTGYGRDEDQRRAHEAGFDLHLTKPVDPEALRQMLASLRNAAAGTV